MDFVDIRNGLGDPRVTWWSAGWKYISLCPSYQTLYDESESCSSANATTSDRLTTVLSMACCCCFIYLVFRFTNRSSRRLWMGSDPGDFFLPHARPAGAEILRQAGPRSSATLAVTILAYRSSHFW